MLKQAIIILILGFATIFGSGALYQAKVHSVDFIDEQQIIRFFEGYNTEYFEGKLPPTEIHFVKNLKWEGERDMGLIFPGNPYRIYVDSEYQRTPTVAQETVIHEMCHEAVDEEIMGLRATDFDSHGPQFQKCMLRVAQAGGFKGIW